MSHLGGSKDIAKFRKIHRFKFFTFIAMVWFPVSCRWITHFVNCPRSAFSLRLTSSLHFSVLKSPVLPSQGPRFACQTYPMQRSVHSEPAACPALCYAQGLKPGHTQTQESVVFRPKDLQPFAEKLSIR